MMIKINEKSPATDLKISRQIPVFKIVMLGEFAVGKSCLLSRLIEQEFYDVKSTIGAAYCSVTMQVKNTPVKLSIWDTAGQERFHSLLTNYYRDAHAAIIVYDTTQRVTFENAKKSALQLQKYDPRITKMLVGNKIDLMCQRSIKTQEAQTFADENDLLFMETSAKTNLNAVEIFKIIALELKNTTEMMPLVEMIDPNPIPEKPIKSCC